VPFNVPHQLPGLTDLQIQQNFKAIIDHSGSGGSGGGGGVLSQARVRRTVDANLGPSWNAIPMDTVEFDTGGYWSTGYPTRLTVPATGYYSISASIYMPGVAGSVFRQMRLIANGTGEGMAYQMDSVDGGTAAMSVGTAAVELTEGSYVELQVRSGDGAGTVITLGNDLPNISIVQLSNAASNLFLEPEPPQSMAAPVTSSVSASTTLSEYTTLLLGAGVLDEEQAVAIEELLHDKHDLIPIG